ncbi:MAG TPA: hypothetical protein VFB06_15570 [Streptosporangiaceae bacterium]|nr:hypothetical protein [Streptosporangiaceae bacterium]
MTAQLTPRPPTSRTGWPVLRAPKWMLPGAVVLVAGLAVAAWPHQPSNAERVSDLRSVVSALNTGIESCAGGVTESLTALREIQAGTSHDVSTGARIATDGAANCSPANSMPMDDLVEYQVPGSLASFHLDTTVNDVVTWGFPLAQRVQTDVASILTASSAAAVASATAALHKDQAALDAQRAKIDAALGAANRALSAHVPPPTLPS